MTREVQLPRRRWLTLRTTILSGLVAGCTTGALTPLPAAQPVPLSIYRYPVGECGAPWLTPAVLCDGYQAPKFDGCHWTCARWEPRQ